MSLAIDGTLDTNILLRFLLKDVQPQHQKAKKIVESSKIWHISMLSIAEIVFVLTGIGFTRDEIKINIELLSNYSNLYMQRNIVLPALDLYATHPAISFMDACLAFESVAEYATPLWTFDRKLANQVPQAKLLTV